VTIVTSFRVGLFLPIGEHGFIVSKTSPSIQATYGYNKEVTLLAEELGYDFVFSMIKYRGFGVESPFWHSSLESLTLSAALAACTERIQVIGSVSILTIPPGPLAKMATTIDHVSHGRFGLNIVSGSFPSEMQQMGLWRLDHDTRYLDAAEYVTCLKKLWTEDRADFDGEFHRLVDCESNPKPLHKPHPPVMCAGISEAGMRFTAAHGDSAFLALANNDAVKQAAVKVKGYAQEEGRSVETMACFVPIGGATQAEAEERYQLYVDGKDRPGVQRIAEEFGMRGGSTPEEMFDQLMFFGTPLVGDAEMMADALFDLQQNGVDGAVLMLPDYIEDQIWMAQHVMPKLRERLGSVALTA
jgi:pyrimidine oxygenase